MFNAVAFRRLCAEPEARIHANPQAGAGVRLSASQWAQHSLQVELKPGQADLLDHPGPRLIAAGAKQWGKSAAAIVKALHEAVSIPGSQVLIVTATEWDAEALLSRILAQTIALGLGGHGAQDTFEFPNGSRIRVTANPSQFHPAHLVIVDDASGVADCLIAAALSLANGTIWLLSSPDGRPGLFNAVCQGAPGSNWRLVNGVSPAPVLVSES